MNIVQPAQVVNPQQLTATVAGPDGATALLILDGQFPVYISVTGGANATSQTFSLLLGPVLTRQQFVKAIATASFATLSVSSNTAPVNASWSISSVDADWDDESGQVNLRVELTVISPPNTTTQVTSLSYHVTVLAAI